MTAETESEAASAPASKPVAGYAPHAYHAADRTWAETNCYVDIWIELLSGQGLEVPAFLPFTIASDFEGDQWTFYKPPHSDLALLYGIEVVELTLWKGLLDHCRAQLDRGRIPLVEMDAYYLPDTLGRDYRRTHTKTTIGIQSLDPERESLRYFHNRALFELHGEDFRGLFGLDGVDGDRLPPYCEIIKLDRIERRSPAALRALSTELLRSHRARAPEKNPLREQARVVTADLEALIGGDPDVYDLYAFAGIRQCGSCFGFTADLLRWLAEQDPVWRGSDEPFDRISTLSSMLVLKMARIAHSGRLRDLAPTFEEMADAWERGLAAVDRGLAG